MDSCTALANSHRRTLAASTPVRLAILAARAPGSAASLSSQFSMCCSTS